MTHSPSDCAPESENQSGVWDRVGSFLKVSFWSQLKRSILSHVYESINNFLLHPIFIKCFAFIDLRINFFKSKSKLKWHLNTRLNIIWIMDYCFFVRYSDPHSEMVNKKFPVVNWANYVSLIRAVQTNSIEPAMVA